jgi:hypothetical protein
VAQLDGSARDGSARSATPAATKAIPAMSAGPRSWRRTITPITYRITGEDCFIMRVYAAAIDEFETVLDKFLLYGQTTSSIVQSAAVPPRSLPLPGSPSPAP